MKCKVKGLQGLSSVVTQHTLHMLWSLKLTACFIQHHDGPNTIVSTLCMCGNLEVIGGTMGRANTTAKPLDIWAAWCNTWLLIKLTPNRLVFSFLFFSVLSTLYLEVHALLALEDANELTGDDAALVDELVEGVLPIGARLPKVHLTRLKWQPAAINRHPLTVALHRHLEISSIGASMTLPCQQQCVNASRHGV